MAVEITLNLFGKPEWEFSHLAEAKVGHIKKKGDELQKRLHRAAEITAKLEQAGWDRGASLYDLLFFKDINLNEAKAELKRLGIRQKEVHVMQVDDEEFVLGDDGVEDEDFDDEVDLGVER